MLCPKELTNLRSCECGRGLPAMQRRTILVPCQRQHHNVLQHALPTVAAPLPFVAQEVTVSMETTLWGVGGGQSMLLVPPSLH